MDKNKEDIEEKQVSPGAYLAYERQKRGVALQEIATALHLSQAVLEALEADAHDKLPETVYVRGYIRSYCHFLRIDETEVLSMYSKNLPEKQENLLDDMYPTSSVNEKTQKMTLIWGSVAVVSVIVFFLFFNWWQPPQSQFLPSSPIEHNPKAIAESKKPAEDISNNQPDILAPVELRLKRAEPEPKNRLGDVDADSETLLGPTQNQIRPPTESHDSILIEPEKVTDADIGTELFSMMVTARGESWARITDGSDEIIIHRILPPGYGKAFVVSFPITVELGDARHVSIMFEGVEHDMSSYIRHNNTAFFKVTELP